MKKNITLIGINYFPESSAIGLYSTQLAEYLAQTNNVEVITGFPYYPEWKISNEYENKSKYFTETIKGITIYRYKQYVPSKPNFKNRVFHLLDFTVGSVGNIFKLKKSDLIICVVPFTSSIVLGVFLSMLRGGKVWVHIQDFEFDAALDFDVTSKSNCLKSKIFKGLFWLERWLLNKADIVSTISEGMVSKLESKTSTMSYLLPNWVDPKFLDPKTAIQHEVMASDKFKVLYSGNIGEKQDWAFFVEVVKYFRKHKNIVFIVVGAGSKKEWLVKQLGELNNIDFFNPVAYEELPNLLCSADLHVLFQKNNVIDTVMPSKLLGMMASQVVSLVTGNEKSEVSKIFKKSRGGYFFDSGCFQDVVAVIENLSSHQEVAKEFGANARSYIIHHFSVINVLNDFGEKVREVMDT